MAVLTQVCELGLMASGSAFISAPRVGIYTAGPTPTKQSVKADFTAASYTGYAVVTPTVSASYVHNPGQVVSVDVSDATFNGPTSGAGVDAKGWYMYDNVTNDLYAAEEFVGGPLSLQNPTDRITVDSRVGLVGSCTSEVQT